MTQPTDRLLSQLNQSQLQQKDNPLYQVIKQLIQRIKELEDLTSSGGATTNITNQTLQQYFLSDGDGGGGEEAMPIPGPIGATGAIGPTGAEGPPFPALIYLEPDMAEDVLPIPGPQGIQGVAGNTGAQGEQSIGFVLAAEEPDDPIIYQILQSTSGGSSLEDWEGKIIVCAGDGNPNIGLDTIQIGVISPTPTQITISQGRVSYFKLKTAITVATIRWYGVGNTTTIYHIAIYRASDNARISADNNPSTVIDTWNSVADSFTLAADTLYYCVVSADSTGATAGIGSIGGSIARATGQIRALPTDWPGNLDWDSNYIVSYGFAVVAVTSGVLPDPGNAPTAFAADLTGGMPAIFLDAA